MRLSKQTFKLYNQASRNALKMTNRAGNMMNQGLRQMNWAAGGYRDLIPGAGQAMQGYGQAMPGIGSAMGSYGEMGGGLGNAMGAYNQMTGMTPSDIQAGSLPQTDLGGYMNPYQKQVTDATMSELNRQETMQDNALQDQAQRAGAFGGDRMAIQQAENNRNFDATRAQTLANLNSQNFNNAQNMATQDINRNFQAQQSNQGMKSNMMQSGAAGLAGLAGQGASGLSQLGQFGASGLGQMGLAGLSGFGGMGQARAGMGQNQMQFGQNQLGALSQQGFNMGQSITNQNLAMGQMQQQQQQQLLDAIKAQTQAWQNYGDTGLARYFGATQSPNGYGTTNTTGNTTTTNNPGGMGILGSVLQLGGLFM